MSLHYTTNYGIAWADLDTAAVDLATASQQAAQTIDTALGRGGIAPPDATTQAQLAARTTTLEARMKVAPVVYTDGGTAGTWSAPTATAVQPGRTIDPAAIFGAGYGALVVVDQKMMLDYVSGGVTAYWYLNLLRGGAVVEEDGAYLQVGSGQTRVYLRNQHAVVVAAGSTAAFTATLTVPGQASTTKATSATSAANNRIRYAVHPIRPQT